MSGDRPLAQCWHKPLHCINTGGGELVWLGFAARIETKREREKERRATRTEQKRKEKKSERGREREKERGHCGLRLKRSIHPSAVTSAVPCPLFSPFSIPFTGMPPQRTTRMDLVFRVCLLPIAASDLSETILPLPRGFASEGGRAREEKKEARSISEDHDLSTLLYTFARET